MIAFLRWWLMFCLMGVGVVILQKFGLFVDLYNADASKISFGILSIFTAMSGFVGYLTFRRWKTLPVKDTHVNFCWFTASKLTTLGMIGTVIGFIMMLSLTFRNLNVEDVASVQNAIEFMALGMGTALVTTLVGLICGLLLELQLVNYNGKT